MMKFVEDPAHGWLAVSRAEYPCAADSGTGYGYQDSTTFYLEEDCELSHFLLRHPAVEAAWAAGTIERVYVPRFARRDQIARAGGVLDALTGHYRTGAPIPLCPAHGIPETVKRVDLFGAVTDTYRTETELNGWRPGQGRML